MRAWLCRPSYRSAHRGVRAGLLALSLLLGNLPAARLAAEEPASARAEEAATFLKAAEPLIAAGRWPEVIPWFLKARDAAPGHPRLLPDAGGG